ncbi:type I-D CRISPR-associated protein Cas10d/Csc3 [Kallotenue papyrolyticum]|uniref:type I-D CRISPR-associated protein Cas10d/Csc3 n=1 Tax=Kallotenue papyrolyticum TaxID=1325125 RepID=UPI0004924560|nr:type I-D CRISPR-associated protein Cas10d/Csc3 [Kallotenue papyrolyticum]
MSDYGEEYLTIHHTLLRRAVAERPAVLRDFVEQLAPRLLLRFSSVPALGGSGQPPARDPELPASALEHTPETWQRFAQGHDQSLAAHLFNGIFAGARIAERLPSDKALTEEEWRVWILGFIVHDYTKVYGIQIAPQHLDDIRALIRRLGRDLRFDAFLAAWERYLDDIVFIAQNTQKVQGANLDWSAYLNLGLHPRRLLKLRHLASFADVLVHIAHPADVGGRDSRGRDTAQNLRSTLGMLFGLEGAPRLAYHQLTEVRGLLSNLINNALLRALEAQGYEPFLFFPDGVVYLAPQHAGAELDHAALLEELWQRVGLALAGVGAPDAEPGDDTAAESEEGDGGGLRITRTKDYLKVPPVLYELLTPAQLLAAGRRAALAIRNALAAERLGAEEAEARGLALAGLSGKEKKAQLAVLGQERAQREGLPTDVRVDQLAEFLGFVWRRLLQEWWPKAEWTTRLLLETLELQTITPAQATAQRGGTPSGWFYVAARYLQQHPLDPAQLEALMEQIGERVLAELEALGQRPPQQERFSAAFRDYVAGVVVLDGRMLAADDALQQRFAREWRHYVTRKAANKLLCSICSSPYEAQNQDKSEVLFKPQQYSNKGRLDSATVVRGICPICALEMMLRQVQQGLAAGRAQDQKPITLYLYPTYFFTPETAQVARDFVGQLRDLPLPDLIRYLDRHGFELETLARYPNFLAPADEAFTPRTVQRPAYSEEDLATLFFFSLRAPMSGPTDTDAWIMPTFYALALPLLLDVKVVATESFVPIYSSGAEFRETAVLDAPHGFVRYIVPRPALRVDEIAPQLWRLLRLYQLHLDAYSRSTRTWDDLRWGMFNGLLKDLVTDPLAVFSAYERKQRQAQGEQEGARRSRAQSGARDGIAPFEVQRYLAIYQAVVAGRRDDPMDMIRRLVDGYAAFYRAGSLKSAYGVVRPLATAIAVTVESDPATAPDDLLLLIAGALNDDMERVRGNQAEGYDPIARDTSLGSYPERLALSRQKIEEFARLFRDEVFLGYCRGDRGLLRERANRLRSAARFAYLSTYAYTHRETSDVADEADAASAELA